MATERRSHSAHQAAEPKPGSLAPEIISHDKNEAAEEDWSSNQVDSCGLALSDPRLMRECIDLLFGYAV